MLISKLVAAIISLGLLTVNCSGNALITPSPGIATDPVHNADVINIHGSVKHLERLDAFMDQMQRRQDASVVISHYTIEGDPIYHRIEYRNGAMNVEYDTTQDKFGSGKIISYTCQTMDKSETDTEMKYSLHGCSGEAPDWDVLHLSYDVSKRITSPFI
ncbi:hypothetical protein SK3146_02120 [Paenibacillus konkukensis]|uniref:DUF4362 domain-containing protein n=1 Tax=Paenibacillus konkukensis TaxID=2020716 RepID=A0ABY4RM17_9BACL|nr:DUF4362 domain-containing protein [Paenibacillus konkukensis]UQZ82960.1 hypothetical protein SK3146_02120 [Paenibacillus konkukensis]